MIRFQKYLVAAFLGLWSVMAMGQKADFEIRNFCERTTDLSAINSDYIDLNGNPAALIRFTVRDSQFEFEANWGIFAQENKTGEVYLYVPQDTKRLTIRHPRLGVLKDYEIPVKIRSKMTYGADIVITEKARPKQEPQQVVVKEPVTAPSHQPQLQPQSVSPKGKTKSDVLSEFLYKRAMKNMPGKKMRTDSSDGDLDKESNFYVIRTVKCPAVLTENFFYTNKEDLLFMTSDQGIQEVVRTHVEGVIDYLDSLK